jgi:hypothetical protein
MGEQFPAQPQQDDVSLPAPVHGGSDQGPREARLRRILRRADERDRAAERRDRDSEHRSRSEVAELALIDRDWAARDREGAAADRADLLGLLRELEAGREPPD